ncbi:MAG: hypothetical protein U1C33_05290, partial [Candidatus Cloacimonadaceae bacterium]|nr:hypothetical protein [Candidatus Cloacimonadaceae bacterium]
MKQSLIFLLLISWFVLLLGVEVGGHITVDTTWTPEENPYIVTSFLYIQSGVTLTIHPGVEVRIIGASKDNIFNFFWSGNNQPIAKMIVVFGRINAFGTEDQ